jgi:hypothetical protein
MNPRITPTHRFRAAAIAALVLPLCCLASLQPAIAAPVTVEFVARVATSSGTAFGLSVPMDTEVTGSFTYDTSTPDTNVSESRGDYYHTAGAFTASITGFATVITGSSTPLVRVENLSVDTFRFNDGPDMGGTMAINAQDDPDVQVGISVTDGSGTAFPNDDLPAFFPFDFTQMPHTFSLKDDRGTLLLQVLSVTPVGSNSWGGLKAAFR